jgi:hypothetical protein
VGIEHSVELVGFFDTSRHVVWDQLSNFCITNRYYYSDVPFLAVVVPASYKSNLPARL